MAPSASIDVDVVRACRADFLDLRRFREVLSEDEVARAGAYKVDEPRDVFALARGLLRLELAKRLHVPPGDIRFDTRPSGKPDLRQARDLGPDWRFSVSHTGPHVALAFALGFDVGIDIERLDRNVRPMDIAKRYFTATELRSLEGFAVQDRTRAFFAGWTRKEAVVKARGSTMAESLTTLSVDLNPKVIHPRLEDAASASKHRDCRLTAFEFPDQNLIGAVAVQSDRTPGLRFSILSQAAFD